MSNALVTQQYVEAAIEPGARAARVTQQYVEVAYISIPLVPTDLTAAAGPSMSGRNAQNAVQRTEDTAEEWGQGELTGVAEYVDKLVLAVGGYSANICATMTSNSTPSPNAADASSEYSTLPAYNAFDKSTATKWSTAAGGEAPCWISYDFGAGNEKVVQKYSITANGYAARTPASWVFEGWDGSEWVQLDSRSGEVFLVSELKEFTFNNATAYQAFRLNISANGGDANYTQIAEVGLYSPTYNLLGTRTSPPLDLTSVGLHEVSAVAWAATTPASTTLTVEAFVSGETAITAEAVGTGDGVETVFTLDNYPVARLDDLVVKVDGVATTAFTLSGRTITFSSPPGAALAVTADYTGVAWPAEVDWVVVSSSGDSVPGLAASEDLTSQHVWIRQTLETTDTAVTPLVSSVDVYVAGSDGSTAPSGPSDLTTSATITGQGTKGATSSAETSAAAALTTSGTKAAPTTVDLTTAADLIAEGFVGVETHQAPADLTASGALTAAGVKTSQDTADLTGSGALTTAGDKTSHTTTDLTGSGAITTAGAKTTQAATDTTAASTVTISGDKISQGAADVVSQAALTTPGAKATQSAADLITTANIVILGERVEQGTGHAVLVAGAALTTDGVKRIGSEAALTAEPSPDLAGYKIASGTVDLVATAELSITAMQGFVSAAEVTAISATTFEGIKQGRAPPTVAAVAGLDISWEKIVPGQADLEATAAVVVAGFNTIIIETWDALSPVTRSWDGLSRSIRSTTPAPSEVTRVWGGQSKAVREKDMIAGVTRVWDGKSKLR